MGFPGSLPGQRSLTALVVLTFFVQGFLVSDSKDAVDMSGFDDEFLSFMEKNHYKAGAIGVMKDGKLVHAKGFSLDKDSAMGSPLSVSPSSSFSKTLTAAAILRLVEAGKLDLHQTVFCTQGILRGLKPWNSTHMADRRACDITVDHLLRHTSGWDATLAPMYDPLLNQLYVGLGHPVPDIATEMGAATPYHIMRFMLGRKLDFTPGTKVVYSNFDYSVLGRVVVEVSGTSYEAYVKKEILDTCGMWHTRLGKQRNVKADLSANEVATLLTAKPANRPGLYQALGPYVIDSALGWHSNVFDIMRFMRCLDGSGVYKLLSSRTLKKITKRPSSAPVEGNDTWYGAGFTVKRSGELWVVADQHTDGMVVHHTGLSREKHKSQISWVLLLEGRHHGNLRQESRKLVNSIKTWPVQDLFVSDLTDFRYDAHSKVPLIKLKLSEHHLNAFVSAAKFQRQKITWLSGHSGPNQNTHFTLMTSHAATDDELDYVFESGLTMKTVERHRKKLKSFGYKLTRLQSYLSKSHESQERYACVFESLPDRHALRVGLKVDHKQYQVVYDKLIHTGFMPKSQSVTSHHGYHVSYIFEQKTEKNFKSYIGVKLPELDQLVRTNAQANRGLAYLDATTLNNRPSFSAVFKHSSAAGPWVFYPDLSERALHKTMADLTGKGMIPQIIVRVPSERRGAKYAAYFRRN